MANSPDFVDFVLEALEPLAGVSAKRMFGGHGLYKDGRMFALIASDVLFLKADNVNRPDFEAAGLARFTPFTDRPGWSMSYYEAAADFLDEPEALLPWARGAFEAALRAPEKKRKKTQDKG